MLRSTLKRNVLSIALIAIGCMIFLTIILYLFRAHLETVGWVMLGLLMIAAGVIGIVATRPKPKTDAGAASPRASYAPFETSPPPTQTVPPGQPATITLSKPALIGGLFLVVSLVLLVLYNLGIAVHGLLTIRETHIVDCREVARYVAEGWQFVSTYSYRVEDAVSGHAVYTNCVMEQERFRWDRDRRAPKETASIDDADITLFDPGPYVEPEQPSLHQPPATQIAPLSPTPWPLDSPLPTSTPPSSMP